MKINCVITDDEPLARKGLKNYVAQIEFLQLQGTCEDALQLNQLLSKQATDLLFLDINMPHLSGLDFLKMIKNPPLVIITTAYPKYAVESFELDVLDYLVKPISFERFLKASNKARHYFELNAKSVPAKQASYCFLKCQKRLEKIVFAEILYLESMQNYVKIHFADKTLIAHSSLKAIKAQLPPAQFVQSHKSFIVAIEKVVAVEGNRLFVGTYPVPMSKYLKEEVLKRLAI